jgi:hypothetical protein
MVVLQPAWALVVDDEPQIREILTDVLAAGARGTGNGAA